MAMDLTAMQFHRHVKEYICGEATCAFGKLAFHKNPGEFTIPNRDRDQITSHVNSSPNSHHMSLFLIWNIVTQCTAVVHLTQIWRKILICKLTTKADLPDDQILICWVLCMVFPFVVVHSWQACKFKVLAYMVHVRGCTERWHQWSWSMCPHWKSTEYEQAFYEMEASVRAGVTRSLSRQT